MAFSTRVETFTVASLPAWMTDASTAIGTAVVSGGVLTLTAGDGTGETGQVTSSATDALDSFFLRMYPMPAEPLAVAMAFLDASFDGYGFGVGTSSSTPGDAELRVNKWVAGSLSHPDSETYSSTDHRWFQMRISGSDLIFETAPDSGDEHGSWTSKYTVAYGSDNSGWDKDNSTLYIYNDPNTVDAYGNVAVIDGINGPTVEPAVAVDQEGFRWRNDDGSESAATWKAGQDTDITEAAGVARLRVLLNGSGDPAAATYQLEYRRNSRPWAKPGEAPFPDYSAAPTVTSFGSDATAHLVTMPSWADGDLIVVLFANDGSATVTNPDSGVWTQLFSTANGTACRFSAYARVATGSGGGTVDFVTSASENAAAQVYRIPAALWSGTIGEIQVGTSATGTSTAPNPPSVTPAATRDWLAIACYGADDDDDASVYPTDYGIHQTYTQSASTTTSCSVGSASRQLRSGSAFDPGTFTIAASEEWVAQTILIPPTAVAVELEASANIAASAATSTTAQLTAPSGKTTGDHVAGRISDDTNPMPSLNITTDDYMELEWSIEALASVVAASDVLDFRVTASGTPLDSYTETPTWTIAASGVDGDLAVTLDSIGLTSAGTVALDGDLALTLDTIGLAASGAVDVVGAAAITLDGIGLASAGAVAVVGTLDRTLDDVGLTATAAADVTGAVAVTLDGLGVTADGTVALAGSAAITLDSVGLASAGVVTVVGAATPTLDGIGLDAVGAVEGGIVGTLAVTLDGVGLVAAGVVDLLGTVSVTLDSVGLASAGAVAVVATAEVTLDGVGLEAVGGAGTNGTAAITLDGIGLASAGTVALVGAAAITLDGVSLDATGTVPAVGTLAITLDTITLDADGGAGIVVGGLDLTLDGISLGAAGVVAVTGGAEVTLSSLSLTAAGAVAMTGAAAIQLAGIGLVAIAVSGEIIVTGERTTVTLADSRTRSALAVSRTKVTLT